MPSKGLARLAGKGTQAAPSKGLPKGLCATCERLPTCTYTQLSSSPVIHCDEYDNGGTREDARPRTGSSKIEPGKRAAGPADSSAGCLGLCRDCAGRTTCAFPRPEGGVWQCEEYE